MVGYFGETFLMTPAEKDQARRRLLDFATSNGCHMPRIFVEELPSAPTAFKGLLAAVNTEAISAVAILRADVLQPQQRAALAAAGVTVLVADRSP